MQQRTPTLVDRAPVLEPRSARASSRTSGEGSVAKLARPKPQIQKTAPKQTGASANLLRHNLTAPEKKTLKRIEALRRFLKAGVDDDGHRVDPDSTGARIFDHLKIDRGLQGNVGDDGCAILAGRLVDAARLDVPGATLVGDYLREVGATERGSVTPERVKAALQALNDALYDHDRKDAPIPAFVRELKLEKRDGGLQIAALLRANANQDLALRALEVELQRAGFHDIVVRTTPAPAPVAAKPMARLNAVR